MANYFVVNSKFKPYSFDEMLKPYALYGQAYKEQEAALDAAREKEFSADKLDQNLDSVAYNMYNNASNDLRAVSDELATQGLSTGLRGRIKSVARDYKTTMDALNEAQARLYAEQDRRAKMGEDYVYQQNDIRIGDFLNGATPNQKSASLSNVTKNIATQFATRAKAITNDTWDKVIGKNGKVIGGYYDVTTESGLTAAQLDSILNLDDNTWNSIMNDNSISKEQRATLRGFRDAITNEKTAIGFDKYQPDDQDAINNAIAIGATAGLGTTTHKYEADRGYNPIGWAQINQRNNELIAKYPWIDFKTGKVKDGVTQKDGNWVDADGRILGKVAGASSTSTSSSGGATRGATRKWDTGVTVYDTEGNAIGNYSNVDKANGILGKKQAIPGETIRRSITYVDVRKDGKQQRVAVPAITSRNAEILADEMNMTLDENDYNENGELSNLVIEEILNNAAILGITIRAKTSRDREGNIKDQAITTISRKSTIMGNNISGESEVEEDFDENSIPIEE